MIRKALSLRL